MNKENIAEVITILRRMEQEIKDEGLIPTADELINRLEVVMESYRLVANDRADE